MNVYRRVLGRLFGRRPARHEGRLRLEGIERPVHIQRDGFGVPYIEAATDEDAWFGLGFCQGQDRSFQLEILLRLCRGTLAELVGAGALEADRLTRRIGFRRIAAQALPRLDGDVRSWFEAFVRGINCGRRHGCTARAHEFALLAAQPTPWEIEDALAMSRLVAYMLTTNWDTELVRLKILEADGPEALRAIDPVYAAHHPVSNPPGAAAGACVDRLVDELDRLRSWLGQGASNSWAVGGAKTVSGRPILANDPHLNPSMPSPWYLASIETPEWRGVGAAFVGSPGLAAGHNGHLAWGTTAGQVDVADLVLLRRGDDGAYYLGDRRIGSESFEEVFRVRGGRRRTEEVVETELGPIIGPALGEERWAIALCATWMRPSPLRGFFDALRARDGEAFREAFRAWPGPSLNLLYATDEGRLGWALVGAAPQRRRGWGLLPITSPEALWADEPVPFDDMPWSTTGPEGALATANNQPLPEGKGPYLGSEWATGYRAARIFEMLAERDDWDIESTCAMQLDTLSIPWREARPVLLALRPAEGAVAEALDILEAWSGRVDADSAGAALWEVFLREITQAALEAKAPASWSWAMGRGLHRLKPFNQFAVRRLAHTIELLRRQPAGWFPEGWPAAMGAALERSLGRLEALFGPDPREWSWGRLRPLTFRHPLGRLGPLGRVFDLGPLHWGGDTATLSMCTSDPVDLGANPIIAASLRMAVEVGRWDEARFILPGGQSGNPLSPHYDDQWPLWQRGETIPIVWSAEARRRRCSLTLDLLPSDGDREHSYAESPGDPSGELL